MLKREHCNSLVEHENVLTEKQEYKPPVKARGSKSSLLVMSIRQVIFTSAKT